MGLHIKKFETEQEYDDFTASDSYVKHNVSVIWPSKNVHYDVRGSHVTGVTLNKTTTEIKKGLTETLIASVRPNTAEDKSVTWSTTDSAVATVDDGVITAVGCGNATITVTTTDGGYTAQCATSVINPLTNISLNKNLIGISTGDTYQLEVEYSPSDTCDSKNVSWATSNRNVATVNNGLVSGVAFGSATISATVGSFTATCAVDVFPVSNDYLTFVATEDGTFKFSGNSIDYSLDDGSTWTTLASDTNSPTITNGNSVLWKATLTPTSGDGIGTFSSTGNFMVAGNPMSLLYGDDFADKSNLSEKEYAFRKLFGDCTKLTNAAGLSLPALTLGAYCYIEMFKGCTSLTAVPSLPASTLSEGCYYNMFSGCTSLTTPPILASNNLADLCYDGMFNDCTSLTTAPVLSATTLTRGCYCFMFSDCTSLTTAPVLPAMTMVKACYAGMFWGCTSLTTAPELPATTLATRCYDGMFCGCSGLTTPPSILPANTLVDSCYWAMFSGCKSLTATPTLSFTRINSSGGIDDDGVCRGMFRNCTSLTTAPVLSATTLAPYDTYCEMFAGCTGLINIPSNMLPATTLQRYAYKGMFKGCTSMTTAPNLPAATIREFCYDEMFSGCTSLNSITCLATNLSNQQPTNWVVGVSPTGTFTKKAGVTTWPTGNNGIPNGWTVVDAS